MFPNGYYPYNDFNSHAHVERDNQNAFWFLRRIISTHTLTWSVTLCLLDAYSAKRHFNSHAHVERDWLALWQRAMQDTFQLTRSRGA